jgi:Condensation domain/TubC N-terminal docking domain
MQELNTPQFIASLKRRGIDVCTREGRLQISAPAGAIDPKLRAELARRKPGMIAFLESVALAPTPDPLRPAMRTGRIPQTQAQQGMWLIDHFDPGHIAYNIPEAFVVEAAVDREALQQAVDGLIERHESLRTSFYEEDGELLQAVLPEARTLVGYSDLSGLVEDSRQKSLESCLREQARLPFDLARPPLVKFHLFRMSAQRHVLFFNIHHIISDARSLAILRRDITELYRAAAAREPAVLPALTVQYPDYAIWIDRHLRSSSVSAQIEHWKLKLAGAPAVLDLPFGRPLPERRTTSGATLPVSIPAHLCDKLKTIGREGGATPFITLLAAFAVLMYQQTGKEDFCIGSPVTHRRHVETEPLIGLFVNMVAFRCDLKGSPSFRELLRRLCDTCLEAFENSDVPFQEVVRALKPDPRLQRSPLFQIMFSLEQHAAGEEDGMSQIDTKPGTARFDLTLQLHEDANGITGSFEYCTDLFDESNIAKLARQFDFVLQRISIEPDAPISSIARQ